MAQEQRTACAQVLPGAGALLSPLSWRPGCRRGLPENMKAPEKPSFQRSTVMALEGKKTSKKKEGTKGDFSENVKHSPQSLFSPPKKK